MQVLLALVLAALTAVSSICIFHSSFLDNLMQRAALVAVTFSSGSALWRILDGLWMTERQGILLGIGLGVLILSAAFQHRPLIDRRKSHREENPWPTIH